MPTAPNPTIAAAIAKPVSKPLTALRTGTVAAGAGRAAGTGAGAERGLGVAAGRDAVGAATVGGVEGRGAGAAGMVGEDGGAATADALAGGAPAAGRVGNLMVAVGFGGRLMRTVSFFGCTLAASAGLGGKPPGGGVGLFSAINLLCHFKLELPCASVKPYSAPWSTPIDTATTAVETERNGATQPSAEC